MAAGRLTTVEAYIMLALHHKRGLSTQDIIMQVSGTRKEILESLRSLKDKGLVKVRGTANQHTTLWSKKK